MKKIIVFIILIVSSSLSLAVDSSLRFNDGQLEYSNKNYAKAFNIWISLAENGHIDAQGTVAYLYSQGLGVKQSYSESVKWYRRAAAAGSVEAMYSLGVAFEYGRGVEQDVKKAEYLYRSSYCKGYVIAITSIVALYKKGKLSITSNDEERALKEEAKLLENPSYIPRLLKKTRDNLELDEVSRIAGLSCTAGSKT